MQKMTLQKGTSVQRKEVEWQNLAGQTLEELELLKCAEIPKVRSNDLPILLSQFPKGSQGHDEIQSYLLIYGEY